MVRGFWGDILNSPYVPFGAEIESTEDREKFFKKINFQRIYVSINLRFTFFIIFSLKCFTFYLKSINRCVLIFVLIMFQITCIK